MCPSGLICSMWLLALDPSGKLLILSTESAAEKALTKHTYFMKVESKVEIIFIKYSNFSNLLLLSLHII